MTYEHAIKEPLRLNHTNSWMFRREIYGQVITVTANWIEGLQTWGMACKVNGQLVDHRQAENPIKDAQTMIETAINNCEAMMDEKEAAT